VNPLDHYIDRVKILPPAPRTLTQLLLVLREEDVPAARVVELIRFDAALTAKILRHCNSAAFGFKEPSQDILDALIRLGFNEIYRMAAAIVAETTLAGALPGYGLGSGDLWQHSVVAAVSARLLARNIGSDENLAFTGGILHDIGKIVLSGALAQAGASRLRDGGNAGCCAAERDKLLLGVGHAELGGRLLERWGFPESLIGAVSYHHDPLQAAAHARLAACVYLGNVVANLMGYGPADALGKAQARPEILQFLELPSQDVELLMAETDAALETLNWFARKPLVA
jgi:putative nucleotidyltransferase with HDIG domain